MSVIIDPNTGVQVNPISASTHVDRTAVSRPTVRIQDEDMPRGFRIINMEDYRPEIHTRLSDTYCEGDAPIEITTKNKEKSSTLPAGKQEVEYDDDEEDSEDFDEDENIEIDLAKLKKHELIELCIKCQIKHDPKASVRELRELLMGS